MKRMTYHPTLNPGGKVKCCGGSDATVICVSSERILIHMHTRTGEKYIVGHNPTMTGDGVVWDWGHYYDAWPRNNPEEDAACLAKALADYMDIKEDE